MWAGESRLKATKRGRKDFFATTRGKKGRRKEFREVFREMEYRP
jgi:hypothetical protein